MPRKTRKKIEQSKSIQVHYKSGSLKDIEVAAAQFLKDVRNAIKRGCTLDEDRVQTLQMEIYVKERVK